jgi:hypothetical protein
MKSIVPASMHDVSRSEDTVILYHKIIEIRTGAPGQNNSNVENVETRATIVSFISPEMGVTYAPKTKT